MGKDLVFFEKPNYTCFSGRKDKRKKMSCDVIFYEQCAPAGLVSYNSNYSNTQSTWGEMFDVQRTIFNRK